MSNLHNILQFVCKYSTIPKGSLCNILLGYFHCWLLFKSSYHRSLVRRYRNNVSVFFTGIRGFDSHQYQICLTLVCLNRQLLQGLKIVLFHVRVYRTYYDRFLRRHFHYIYQVSRRQCNRRECISSTRLYGNSYIFSQLIMNCRDLGLACGNRNRCLGIYLLNLMINSLHHGFI